MVSFVLFYLQTSFSIDFANNLIEKYPTSAATAIICDSVLGWKGSFATAKEWGIEELVGINHNIL